MYQDGVLVIDHEAWKNGISSSPYTGINDMRNLDPHSKVGALLCGRASTLETTAGFFDSFPKHRAYDEDGNKLYVVTEDGKTYSRSGGTWQEELTGGTNWTASAGDGEGAIFWKGYVLLADKNHLNLYKPGTSWSNNWQAFAEGTRGAATLPHTMFVDAEDVVYICDGKYIASLQEVPGQTFSHSNAATYTWNAQALDLADDYVAQSLTSLGTYLIIGTKYSSSLNRGNRADIFPWDRTSASFESPMRAKGNGVWQLQTHQNELYAIIDRSTAKVYASNLTTYELKKEIRNITGTTRSYADAADVVDEQLLFGVGSTDSSVTGCGVYGLKDGLFHLASTPSIGDTGVEIGTVTGLGDGQYIVTWEKAGVYGADLVSTNRVTGYAARLDTALILLQAEKPKQLQNISIHLGKDLETGQGVRISYRESTDDSWTVAHTFDFTTYGAVSHMSAPANMSELRSVQVRVELTTATNSSSSPELLAVIIK